MYGVSSASRTDLDALGIPAAVAGCFEQPDTAVWPDHWESVELFIAMGTQWRTGFGGASGLDYNALPVVFDLFNVAQDRRKERFADLRVLERESLKMMASRRGK